MFIGVDGTGVPGSGWLHLDFWNLPAAAWVWPNPQWPEPRLSVKPCWDLLSMVHDIPILLDGIQLFQGLLSFKGGEDSLTPKEACLPFCGKLEDRGDLGPAGVGEKRPQCRAIRQAYPCLHTPPAYSQQPMATFISITERQCWHPIIAVHHGWPMTLGREPGPPPPSTDVGMASCHRPGVGTSGRYF